MDQTIIVACVELNELHNTSWIATPLYGKLSDIFGRKTCLLFAYTVFTVGCLLCGLSRNMAELVASRALSGIGGNVVPLRSRGTWQGILNIVFATGSTVGASLGGYFADTIGWRWAFLLQVPVTIAVIVSVTLALHLPKVEASDLTAKLKRVDWAGAVSLILTLFLLFALGRGGNVSWNDRLTVYSLAALPICFIAFASIEMKFAREPFAPKRIIVNRTLIASYLVNLFGMASAVLGRTASQAGLWLLIGVFTGLLGSLGSGLMMQATGKYYRLTVISYFSLPLGTVIVSLSTGIIVSSTSGMHILYFRFLTCSSLHLASGITSSLISLIANAGQEDQAIATAVSYLFRSLGSVIGLSVGSTLVQGTLRSTLHRKLSGADVEEIIRKVRESLTYIEKLDPPTQAAVRGSQEAIHVTFWFSATMALFSLISSRFIKEMALANRK
ncbi:MFS general substrate transporter [Phlegmacium glaucopus]|nr:MFS general substrate transporter [Phlegmacium glaucopus]